MFAVILQHYILSLNDVDNSISHFQKDRALGGARRGDILQNFGDNKVYLRVLCSLYLVSLQ